MPLRPLILTIALAAAVFAGTAQAQGQDTEALTGPVIERLVAEGYEITETRRTFLGRILILSENGTFLREVVIHRSTGRILSDRLFRLRDDAGPAPAGGGDPGPGPAPGPGGGGQTKGKQRPSEAGGGKP